MGPDLRPAKWIGPAAHFGPAETPRRLRLHWYREGAARSACENYERPFMAYTWSAAGVDMCPRCAEELVRSGEAVVPPTPPAAERSEDDAS